MSSTSQEQAIRELKNAVKKLTKQSKSTAKTLKAVLGSKKSVKQQSKSTARSVKRLKGKKSGKATGKKGVKATPKRPSARTTTNAQTTAQTATTQTATPNRPAARTITHTQTSRSVQEFSDEDFMHQVLAMEERLPLQEVDDISDAYITKLLLIEAACGEHQQIQADAHNDAEMYKEDVRKIDEACARGSETDEVEKCSICLIQIYDLQGYRNQGCSRRC